MKKLKGLECAIKQQQREIEILRDKNVMLGKTIEGAKDFKMKSKAKEVMKPKTEKDFCGEVTEVKYNNMALINELEFSRKGKHDDRRGNEQFEER